MSRMLKVSGRPETFEGKLSLPPSKSYIHRALFIASLGRAPSKITSCGRSLSDDVLATIETLRAFGVAINQKGETLEVIPGETSRSSISVYAKGSGTTARFAIAFAALVKKGSSVRISGDDSLSRRPMQSIFDSLSQLGVKCSYDKESGKLPITIEGGGIKGGECMIDGSISSQFISSLLISCTHADSDCMIRIKDPSKLVSKPYIDATLATLAFFGLKIEPIFSKKREYFAFKIRANQFAKPRTFHVPGDMSSAAALIGATLAAGGHVKLEGVDSKFPQSDAAMISIARKFGASIRQTDRALVVKSKEKNARLLKFDLNDSPDIVPVVVALAAALGQRVNVSNVWHLRFKESDRISVLSRELRKLGVKTREGRSSLSVSSGNASNLRKPIVIDPQKDHRMLMALVIAGLSGRYGEILIRDPECVRKSYPNFVADLQKLCGEKETVKIVEVSR